MNKAQKLIAFIEGFYKKTPMEQKLSDETKSRDFGQMKSAIHDAVTRYTGHSHEYINEQLRNPKQKGNNPFGDGRERDWSRDIDNIKQMTNNPTQHSFVAYRGISHMPPSKFKEGDLIHDRGFISTTTHKSEANRFKKNYRLDTNNGTLFKIHIEKNTKGAYIADHSNESQEREFLLHPGTKFKVGKTHLNKSGSVSHIDLHIHSQKD